MGVLGALCQESETKTKYIFLLTISQYHTASTDKGWGGSPVGKKEKAIKAWCCRWCGGAVGTVVRALRALAVPCWLPQDLVVRAHHTHTFLRLSFCICKGESWVRQPLTKTL